MVWSVLEKESLIAPERAVQFDLVPLHLVEQKDIRGSIKFFITYYRLVCSIEHIHDQSHDFADRRAKAATNTALCACLSVYISHFRGGTVALLKP